MEYDPATMSIKINFNGIDIMVSTADEAAAVARKLAGTIDAPRGRPKSAKPDAQKNGFDVEISALEFLRAIKVSDSDGATSDPIGKALHVKHPKGIGSRSGMVNDLLTTLGYRPDSVYTTARIPDEGRFWKPGPKLDEAYEAVRRKLSERG